jgi:hypothetical protein
VRCGHTDLIDPQLRARLVFGREKRMQLVFRRENLLTLNLERAAAENVS